jgi:hypothetical protein
MGMETTTSAHRPSIESVASSLASTRLRYANAWLPGRVIGGVALIVGPVLWLTALVLRWAGLRTTPLSSEQRAWLGEQPFAAPGQLMAYAHDPVLVIAGYATFAAACFALIFAIISFARVVTERSYLLGQIGAVAVVASLVARLYFSGIDMTAFRLVDVMGLAAATRFVMDSYVELSYGLAYVPVTAAFGALVGGVLLAAGALRAGVFGVVRSVLLLMWAWTFGGVLKESDLGAIVGGIGLCLVLVPIGVSLLTGRMPSLETSATADQRVRSRLGWIW